MLFEGYSVESGPINHLPNLGKGARTFEAIYLWEAAFLGSGDNGQQRKTNQIHKKFIKHSIMLYALPRRELPARPVAVLPQQTCSLTLPCGIGLGFMGGTTVSAASSNPGDRTPVRALALKRHSTFLCLNGFILREPIPSRLQHPPGQRHVNIVKKGSTCVFH